MKYLRLVVIALLPFLLTSCAWIIINDENENPDGSHFVRLSGNGFASSSDMEQKLNDYANKKCKGEKFTYTMNEKYYKEIHMGSGSYYFTKKPLLDANIKCKNKIFDFPNKINNFTLENKKDYDDLRLGYALNFKSKTGIVITVIVYDLGIKNIKNGLEGAHVNKQFIQAQNDVKLGVKSGLYKSIKALPFNMTLSPLYLTSSYSIVSTDGLSKKISYLFIRGQKKHFIKIRVTGSNSSTIDQEVSSFIANISGYIVPKS